MIRLQRVPCSNCAKPVPRTEAEIGRAQKQGRKIFCGLSCAAEAGNISRDHPLVTTIAEYCGCSRSVARQMLNAYRHANKSASTRGIEFTLSEDEFMRIIERAGGCCELTSLPWRLIKSAPHDRQPYAPSLDRIDRQKGLCRWQLPPRLRGDKPRPQHLGRRCLGKCCRGFSEQAKWHVSGTSGMMTARTLGESSD
jgi:hypothetical protein